MMIEHDVDGLRFELRNRHDFSWIGRYGRVFDVYDTQDSGNICFGVHANGRDLFLKCAGANTTMYNGAPAGARLAAFEAVFDYHLEVEKRNYLAIDFYDGSMLYDFESQRIKICDIDQYERRPYRNTMGRMWGSSRFMSPEEFELGAAVDELTNIYTMGATAFCLLGNGVAKEDRSFEGWCCSRELYETAAKAVSSDRDDRFASVAEFQGERLADRI